jgi:hypothetical protein
MARLLSERHKSYSDGKVSKVRELCEPGLGFDPDSAICLMANHSPRNVIRICERIFSAQAERKPDSSLIELDAIDQGIITYCLQVARDHYSEEHIRELQRIGRELFTINFLANDVFKVHANSVRNKITNWTNAGLIKQVGTISVESSKRPLNFYHIADPGVIRLVHRSVGLAKFLEDRWVSCGACKFDNLAAIELYPNENPPMCVNCGRELF